MIQIDELRPVHLTSARDVRALDRVEPDRPKTADLYGVLTRAHPMGRLAFFHLHDGTDAIQLVAQLEQESPTFSDRPQIPATEWSLVKQLKQGARVRAMGPVGRTRTGELSVFLTNAPREQVPSGHSSAKEPELLPHLHALGNQLLLARLRAAATEYLTGKNFLELEPRLVSTSWNTTGLQPLRIDYPGFGRPIFLAPSPASQLLRALLLCGKPRVFAISRCFTSSYRDDLVSTESVLLVMKVLRPETDELQDLAKATVEHLVASQDALAPAQTTVQGWTPHELPWPPIHGSTVIAAPQMHVYSTFTHEDLAFAQRVKQVFQLFWPPGFAAADGFVETLDGDCAVGTVNVHIERLLMPLGTPLIRRLLNLGA
jgi:hypothetical protein